MNQWFKGNSDDLNWWPTSIERSLREPELGNVTFQISYNPEDQPDVAAICQRLFDSGDEPDWESWARLMMCWFDDAQKYWLHPEHVHGDLALTERHVGIVDRVTDSFIVVRYGDGDDAFESEYPRSQVSGQVKVKRGDRIEAAVGLWHQEHHTRGIDHLISEDEQKALDDAWKSAPGIVVGDTEI